nr:ankyrin repeat domain containing protein 6 [Hymenolepis microstoma]
MFCIGNSCLHTDLVKNNFKSLLKHLADGCDVDYQNDLGDTPLMTACKSEDIKSARLLISFGANLNKVNKQGNSALHIAAYQGNMNLFKILLNNGGNYCLENYDKETALEILLQKFSKSQIKNNFKEAHMSSYYKAMSRHYDGNRNRKFWSGLWRSSSDKENKVPSRFSSKIHDESTSRNVSTHLTILRQIIEALIYLKHLGIVHTKISSHAIYLTGTHHAKLANFEHALIYPAKRGQISFEKMTEEEVLQLAPWLAPEVVVFSQSQNNFQINSNCRADSAYISSFSGTNSSDSAVFNTSMPSPASDVFGMARVMQELLEPSRAYRFKRPVQIVEQKNIPLDRVSEDESIVLRIRPVIKKALRRNPSIRGAIEDLYSGVVQTFWSTSEVIVQGQKEICRWCEGLSGGSNSTTATMSTSASISPYSSSNNTAVQAKDQNLDDDNKENQLREAPSPPINENLTPQPKHASIFRQRNRDAAVGATRCALKEVPFNRIPETSVKDTEETLSECPEPLTFSSPIQEHQPPFKPNHLVKSTSKCLTKEEYIEMVAIPHEPLGPGRSRPQIPWRCLTAPAPLNSTSSSSSLTQESGTSQIGTSGKEIQQLNQCSVIDTSGRWIKTNSLRSDTNSSSSKRVWSAFSKKFRREFKLMKSNQAPIKPASHLTSPPIVSGYTAKCKSVVRLTGVSQLESSLVHKSISKKLRSCDELSDMSLPSPPDPPDTSSKQKAAQLKHQTSFTSSDEITNDPIDPLPSPPASINSNFCMSTIEEKKISEKKEVKRLKICQEAKLSIDSQEVGLIKEK